MTLNLSWKLVCYYFLLGWNLEEIYFLLCDLTKGIQILLPISNMPCYLVLQIFLTESDCHLCPLSAGNDVKDVFASARSGDQYRVLKIVIEDGKDASRAATMKEITA